MKTREDIEKIISNTFDNRWPIEKQDINKLFFEKIIPEVLKSIVGNECIKYNLDISGNIIKQKAKELYGIDL